MIRIFLTDIVVIYASIYQNKTLNLWCQLDQTLFQSIFLFFVTL